ncbi:TPA: YHS domain-containing protein [Candidatus Geothermarchaeota archaeon]|nr:YHS domain-containing protein [Candidatus Geothermarchaeota archaeon]HIQ13711.1 YHS domain-containing protein [Thermoprotei archaeon]
MAKDPVCGMEVNPSEAAAKTVYRGTIYYFCSPQCKTAFEKDPDYYLEHGPKGMPGMEEHEHGHGHHHEHHHGHHHEHHHHHHGDDEGCGCC